MTSSVRDDVVQKEGLSSSVKYNESSWWDFVRLVRRHAKAKHVLFCPVRGIKQAGLRPSLTKSQDWMASPRPSGTSRLDFICLVRSRVIGGLVLVRQV